MRIEYLRPGAAMMWTVPGAGRGRQIRIVIEELPNGTWDWSVWETGRPGTSSFGVRDTAAAALADAAVAASTLGLAAPVGPKRAGEPIQPDRVAPFAAVEKTPHGPKLIVGGVCVHWWIGSDFEADAERMAAEINTVFLFRVPQLNNRNTLSGSSLCCRGQRNDPLASSLPFQWKTRIIPAL